MKNGIKERINKLMFAVRDSCQELGSEIDPIRFHYEYEDDKVILKTCFDQPGGSRRCVVGLKLNNEQRVVLNVLAGNSFKEIKIEVYHPGMWEDYLIKGLLFKIQRIENRKAREAERLLKAKFTPIDDSELFGDCSQAETQKKIRINLMISRSAGEIFKLLKECESDFRDYSDHFYSDGLEEMGHYALQKADKFLKVINTIEQGGNGIDVS